MIRQFEDESLRAYRRATRGSSNKLVPSGGGISLNLDFFFWKTKIKKKKDITKY